MQYDTIGRDYVAGRRTEPRIAAQINAALGDARTVLNVGAGTGSYEPGDRYVLAVEPSRTMRSQRPRASAPVVAAGAEALPFDDDAFDACLGVLTVHHWSSRATGLGELRRVARDRVVVLTIDPAFFGTGWLVEEYVPEVGKVDTDGFLTIDELATGLGGDVTIDEVLIPSDCADGFFEAYWARPEAYLSAEARQCQSAWHRVGEAVTNRAMAQLGDDLVSGVWDARHGKLRTQATMDVGYRLVTARF